VISTIVKLLRFASIVACVIVTASFAIFVVGQTKSASKHQVEAVSNGPSVTTSTSPGASGSAGKASSSHESTLHKAIDEAAQELTSPFAGIVSGSSSEWVIRSVKLLLALAVYGFGLGYLARALRVRV
jgi:hypothetical protein